jgi:hypothetical protein
MTAKDFEQALVTDARALVGILEVLDEKSRRELFPVAQKWSRALSSSLSPRIDGVERAILGRTCALAMLGTAGLSELKKARLVTFGDLEAAISLLQARRPPWLSAYCQWLLQQNPHAWLLVHRLVQLDLVARPEGEAYVLGMIASASKDGAYALLMRHPELLDELPRLFEVEGRGEFSLAAFDKYTHEKNQWATALRQLSEEGLLSREMLIAESLRSLGYGFAAFRAGWFTRFFESLQPTDEEKWAHLEAFYPLLGSPIPSIAAFALKVLAGLVKKKFRLEPTRLWESLGPAWTLAQKGPVLQGLKLLATTPPGEAWLEHLTRAAEHPAPEVQREALRMLQSVAPRPSGPWKGRWLELLPGLEPSVRGDWGAWLGSVDPDRALSYAQDAPTVVTSSGALEPCSDLQEVFDLASRLLEELGPPQDIERMLDGLTRFSGREHRQSATLAKRVKVRLTGDDLRSQVAAVLAVWLGRAEMIPSTTPARLGRNDLKQFLLPSESPPQLQTFLQWRLCELAMALADGSAPEGLHSFPDDAEGHLSAETLASRLIANPSPLPWDFTQALLRLDPDSGLVHAPGEAGEALVAALGGPRKGSRGVAAWWEAVDLLRSRRGLPWSLDVKTTSNVVAGKTYHHRRLSIPELPQRQGAGLIWKDEVESPHSLRWQTTISPALRESFHLLGIEQIANNLDWWGADWSDRVYLETLLVPDHQWTRASAVLVALGLACKESGQRRLAMDAVASGFSLARLQSHLLGDAMAELSGTGMITGKRWAGSFDEMRRWGYQEELFETLQSCIAGADRAFDLRPLLGPLLELSSVLRRSLSNTRARAALSAIRGGKSGQQAAQILAIGSVS